METDLFEKMKASLNALEHLRLAEAALTADQKKHLEAATGSLRKTDFMEAKLAIVKMLELSQKLEELVLALVNVLAIVGESDAGSLADYLTRGKDSKK